MLTIAVGVGMFLVGRLAYAQAWSARIINHLASDSDARFTLRVYNYARIDGELLGAAEKVAARIFDKISVRTEWVECPVTPAQVQAYPGCQSNMGTADLVLRILPHRMANKMRASGEALGVAQTCPENEGACELSVFYSRVEELASNGYRADNILGHVIAHEVTHILLGPGHTEQGIMRGEWSRNDLQRISWGMVLDFSNDQSKQVRYAVLRRMRRPAQEVSTQAN